jgi:hypothetical protein
MQRLLPDEEKQIAKFKKSETDVQVDYNLPAIWPGLLFAFHLFYSCMVLELYAFQPSLLLRFSDVSMF